MVRRAQAAPVDALEAGCHVLGHSGDQAGLADAAHAEDCHQPTALLEHPAAQQRQFLAAAEETCGVRRLPPIFGVPERISRRDSVTAWSRRASGVQRERRCEPLAIERRMHAWRFALRGGPQLACLGRLLPGGRAACLEQHADERLESLGSRISAAGLPVLERAATDASSRGEVSLDQPGAAAVAQKASCETTLAGAPFRRLRTYVGFGVARAP